MKKEDLVIGKTYRVKSKEWFDENKNEFNDVICDGVKFYKSYLCGESLVLNDLCENLNCHENDVELGKKGKDGWWEDNYVPLFAIELDPSDKREISKNTLELIQKLKLENYIYGYDGGPGGGSGGAINTQKQLIVPAFNRDGEESICFKVDGCKRIFTLKKITELFETGKTEQSFKATEYTTIRTELKIIEDKTKLPKDSRWSTMRD